MDQNSNNSAKYQALNKNSNRNLTWIIVGAVALLLFVMGLSTYNSMVNAEEDVNNAWGNVNSSYQRRADLIPNLVNTVKGYATHESQTLERVTAARTGTLIEARDNAVSTASSVSPEGEAPDEEGMTKYVRAQEKLNSELGLYINAVHEAYPDLKAAENFKDLQQQLEGTENRINNERNIYNEKVTEYNKTIRRFPNSVFAGIFGFKRRATFQADEGAQNAPKVDFQ